MMLHMRSLCAIAQAPKLALHLRPSRRLISSRATSLVKYRTRPQTTCSSVRLASCHNAFNTRQLSNNGQASSGLQELPYRHPTFDIVDRVYVVTGGARGLGLSMAEALAENGAHVYCVDILPEPDADFETVQSRISTSSSGSISYRRADVTNSSELDDTISGIASRHERLDGLSAAAGIQYVRPAIEYPPDEIDRMLSVNFKGVYLAATSCARQMIKYGTPGAMLLVGSTSGMNAIKGLRASVYSSSKGAVIQLARSLSMEWGKIVDGQAIRVNALCPGNIITPMVRADFRREPELKAIWENENMFGRLSDPEEFKGATLFLLSNASSFMTGASLVIDGGYTAW